MKMYKQELLGLNIPSVILGCMRMADKDLEMVKQIIQASYDSGITFFDHADIYGKGESERLFGTALKQLDIERSSLWIQSKASIRPGMFDFSQE